ncbi:MAG: methyl-accepting chemotaxis protein [Pelosinus sp.]|nr:methyl-accepting chemotaxis protein [Pelosinus sp.]
MNWFYNLKISVKMLTGFILVAILAGVIGFIGVKNIKQLNSDYTFLYEKHGMTLANIGQVAASYQEQRVLIRDVIMDKSGDKSKIIAKMKKGEENIQDNLEKYGRGVTTDEGRNLYNQLKTSLDKFYNNRNKIIDLAARNQNEQIEAAVIEGGPIAAEVLGTIDKINALKAKVAKNTEEANEKKTSDIEALTIGIVLAVIAIAIALGLFISRSISKPIQKLVRAADKIAVGDLKVDVALARKDEMGLLGDAFAKVISAIEHLTQDAGMLADAAVAGNLAIRADAAKHQGEYRKIIEGVNNTLDSVIGHIKRAADYMEKIAQGSIPEKITYSVNGDFNVIKNSLNNCIDNIKSLVADADMLSVAAVEGNLSIRADASKHQGDYRRIIEGVNKTLDAVIEPITEASAVLQELSQGNLNVSVTGNYKGDHAQIKQALNQTIGALAQHINEISNTLHEMSKGNLNVRITGEYHGNFIAMKEALNSIIDSLNDVLGEINGAAEQVSAGSGQVSASSQSLSQGSTEQASAIEEITASMEEMAAQTKQNAENANQANGLAEVSKETAVQGNTEMQEMLRAMTEINEASSSISKIIKVIDEIAFQTNILALNAAVEAARAGEHGKGFAVVAEEVRNLAARSANAAKETTVMIEGSIKKVETGTNIANATADALNKIVENITAVAGLVSTIATASNEQASGISQVTQGISQVSQVVQTNSATAEECASASEELSSQSIMLREKVGQFRLRKQAGRAQIDNDSQQRRMRLDMEDRSAASSFQKAAPKGDKVRISLSDTEFDKY